jgi:tRNA threonylcarbamoyladenosine modification (KEOPS) complex  Pcc1 subunit
MKYSAQISVKGDSDKLHDCLASESMDFDRSSFKVIKTEDGIKVDITAKDSTALRATLNSITQLLMVYDKIEQVK